VNDNAQHVAVDAAEGVLGAAEDGSVDLLIWARTIFQRRNPRPTHACAPQAALGRHVKGGHVNDVAQTWPSSGARAARALLATPPRPPPLFAQLAIC